MQSRSCLHEVLEAQREDSKRSAILTVPQTVPRINAVGGNLAVDGKRMDIQYLLFVRR